MPEDAPGNPGAARSRDACRQVAVYRRYGGCRPSCTAGRGKIPPAGSVTCSTSSMTRISWRRVGARGGNTGRRTPGIDAATVADIETRIGVGAFLEEIRDLLKSGEFRPVQVRQVMIPKRSGKLRKLGIPTVADRVVQAALKLVLEPIFEADFQPCSYGFRPGRRAHDAIAEIHHLASAPRNYHWVLEADIRACFDEIYHAALMSRLRARIKDKRVLALVKAFLKAGVMTAAASGKSHMPAPPQGGLCAAAHKEPYEQCWVMRSAGLPGLVGAGSASERCA